MCSDWARASRRYGVGRDWFLRERTDLGFSATKADSPVAEEQPLKCQSDGAFVAKPGLPHPLDLRSILRRSSPRRNCARGGIITPDAFVLVAFSLVCVPKPDISRIQTLRICLVLLPECFVVHCCYLLSCTITLCMARVVSFLSPKSAITCPGSTRTFASLN